MSNRKARRAQAKETEHDIKLSQPSREAPNHRTLLDIASERQLINGSPSSSPPSITTTKINADGTLSEEAPTVATEEEETPVWLDTILYTTSLALLHFTLTVLVHHQYAAQPPSLRSLFYGSTIVTPTPFILGILVYILHPRSSQLPVQILFAVLNVVAGVWLVRASNEDPYLAVMKKAPPLGTLWIWAVVELRWEVALAGLAGVGVWAWWRGYGYT